MAWQRFYLTFKCAGKRTQSVLGNRYMRINSVTSPRKQRSRRNTNNLDDLDLANRLSEDPNENDFTLKLAKEQLECGSFVVEDKFNLTMQDDLDAKERFSLPAHL